MSIRRDNNYDDDILKPCFQINPDVELKEVPTTGEEYLLKVINERQNYEEIAECKIDLSKFAKYQNCFVDEEPEFKVAIQLKPTIEWQNMQIADFSEVRMHITRLKQKKGYKKKLLDREPNCQREWKIFVRNLEPTLSIVLALKSALVDLGLETIAEMLKTVPPGQSIDHRTGQWIYSLLICVVHPLLTETRYAVRLLCKRLRQIRSYIDPDSENAAQAVAPLNIFICLISRYFENEDLADH